MALLRLITSVAAVALVLTAATPAAVAQDTAPALRATIDTAKTGEPISKYVYGQFIEHLGRCIYGGIWAERLQDRKFFYGVGRRGIAVAAVARAAAGPEQVMAGGTVKMVTENAYAGEHSPCVEMSGELGPIGIVQDRIALSRGEIRGPDRPVRRTVRRAD